VSERPRGGAEVGGAGVPWRIHAGRWFRGLRGERAAPNGSALRSALARPLKAGSASATDDGPQVDPASDRARSTLRCPPGALLLLSLGLAFAAQRLPPSVLTLLLLVAAAGSFFGALVMGQRGLVLVLPRPVPRGRRGAWVLVSVGSAAAALGCLLALPGTLAYQPDLLMDGPLPPPYWHVVVLWLLSLAAYAAGFVDPWPRGWQRRLWDGHRRECLAVGALVWLGLLLRVVRLDSFPRNFGGDEGSQALSALAVVQGHLTNMFATGWYGTATLYYFVQALPIALVPDPVVGARLTSALVGTAALVVTYLLARKLLGPGIALVALAFLATYDYHIFFSRLATYHVTDTLFVAATLLLAYRAVTRERAGDYALTGLVLGLGLYAYFGARVLPIVLLVVMGREAVTRRGWLREAWPRLLILVGGAIVAAGPLLLHYARYPAEYNHRTNQISVFASGWLDFEARRTGDNPLAVLGGQVLRTALVFNFGPPVDIYYTPDRGLLVWPAAMALLFGMVYALYRCRERPYFLLLAAYWVPAVGASLTEGMPQDQRVIILAPIVAVLVGLGLVVLARLLERYCRLPHRVALAAPALGVLACAALGVQFYFGQWAAAPRYGGVNSTIATELAYYLRGLGSNSVVYLLGGRILCQSYLTIAYLAPGSRCVNVEPDQVPTLAPLSAGGSVVFVAVPDRVGELRGLAQRLGLAGPLVVDDPTYGTIFQLWRLTDRTAATNSEEVRQVLLRGVQAYLAALGAADPVATLRGGGWSDDASKLIGQDFAQTQATARAQGNQPYAELQTLDITSLRPDGPHGARALATVIGATGLRGPRGEVLVQQRSAWQTEYWLSADLTGWRIISVQRLGQSDLADGQPSS
jgi:hypothetical protein